MAEKNTKIKNKNTKKTSKPKRRFRINKKLDGKVGIIFIGHEDPFLYFPDMMSYFDRDEICDYLNKNGIETRPIIAGNIARQPANSLFKHRVAGDLKNSDNIMDNGLRTL